MSRLLRAVAFAARAHRHQLRKDGETPYVSHVFRVCLTVRHVFGVDDEATLTAAVLHDTIEDTTTDFDDIEKGFGAEVAEWVRALVQGETRPRSGAREKYIDGLAQAPWQVKVCKLADVHDNLLDSEHFPPQQRAKTFRNSRKYLNVLDDRRRENASRLRNRPTIVERFGPAQSFSRDLEAVYGCACPPPCFRAIIPLPAPPNHSVESLTHASLPALLLCRSLAFMILCVVSAPTTACPFCSMQGQTLAGEVAGADMVLFGTLTNANVKDDTTDLVLDSVVKTNALVAGKKVVTLPKYIEPDKLTAVQISGLLLRL